jgi:hypothetical protein
LALGAKEQGTIVLARSYQIVGLRCVVHPA